MAELLTRDSCRHTTGLLILQPTPFCNINCDYCYLPHRNDRRVMSIDTVRAAVDFVFREELNAPDLTVVWHAGEPLVVAADWYREAFRAVDQISPSGVHLPHAIQTNGMLIDEAWCDLFLEFGVRVGVSLDGPADIHNSRRKTRSGGPTHARVMRGIEMLRKRGVPFHVICVVGAASLPRARDLMEFFRSAGVGEVGFNIEEIEQSNGRSTLQGDDCESAFRHFMTDVIVSASGSEPAIVVREQQDLMSCLEHPAFGRMSYNSQTAPFGIITVSVEGELFTFSPELAGLTHEDYDTFAIGRLPGATLDDILASRPFRDMWTRIKAGVQQCRGGCDYFDLCLGGAPVNKLFENGSFASAETMFCRLAHKAVSDVVLADLERKLNVSASAGAIVPSDALTPT